MGVGEYVAAWHYQKLRENKVDEMCNLIGILRQDDLIENVRKYAFMNQSDEFNTP